jgi:hypothetical protein
LRKLHPANKAALQIDRNDNLFALPKDLADLRRVYALANCNLLHNRRVDVTIAKQRIAIAAKRYLRAPTPG